MDKLRKTGLRRCCKIFFFVNKVRKMLMIESTCDMAKWGRGRERGVILFFAEEEYFRHFLFLPKSSKSWGQLESNRELLLHGHGGAVKTRRLTLLTFLILSVNLFFFLPFEFRVFFLFTITTRSGSNVTSIVNELIYERSNWTRRNFRGFNFISLI